MALVAELLCRSHKGIQKLCHSEAIVVRCDQTDFLTFLQKSSHFCLLRSGRTQTASPLQME